MPTSSAARSKQPAISSAAAGRRASYWPQHQEQASRSRYSMGAAEVAGSSQKEASEGDAEDDSKSGKYINRIKLISAPSAIATTAASLDNNNNNNKGLLNGKQAPLAAASSSIMMHHERIPTPAPASSPAHHSARRKPPDGSPQAGASKQERAGSLLGSLSRAKLLLMCLTGVDLLVSLLVHHYAQDDQLTVWRWLAALLGLGGAHFRLSLVNLVLSGLWFIVFAAGLLWELRPVLVGSVCVQLFSFVLLLVLSVVHLSRRIDYQSVQLSQLLLLLFLLSLLHVYLLAMAFLTVYLLLGLGQRQRRRRK